MSKTDVEVKRELSEKIAPEIKNLIKQYGYEAVAYTWKKAVEHQRQIQKAKAEVEEAQAKLKALQQQND